MFFSAKSMICKRIVDLITAQIILFKTQREKAWIFILIFKVNFVFAYQKGNLYVSRLQHNMDYVFIAVFGGYFYIINRIFSIR